MGKKSETNEDVKDWPEKNEASFLKILYERVKLDINGAPTFKTSDWKAIDEELFLEIGVRYGEDKLKGKYNRLRIKERQFAELLERTGVTYEVSTNIVNANQDVWQSFFKKNRGFKVFRKSGCKNYHLLTQVFGKSTATGKLHHASTQLPPNSDDERQIEEDILSKGKTVCEAEVSASGSSKDKRSCDDFLPDYIRVKKVSKTEKFDACFEMWATSLEARAQKDLAKAARYKEKSGSKATSPISNPYTIEECMDVLEMIEDVSDESYNNALEKLKDEDWRKMFIKMSAPRRKTWLDRLGKS
ncbi:hypothetical protein ACHQM5_030706 [Ranunculus cassubicifolius]